ncbi:hypothetical protein AB0C21_04720 [Spirillospora sp. NPDC049024]
MPVKASGTGDGRPPYALAAVAALVAVAVTLDVLLGGPLRHLAAAHAMAAGVAVAVVTLGYHWPTGAVAGWALGLLLACLGRILVLPRPPRREGAVPAYDTCSK